MHTTPTRLLKFRKYMLKFAPELVQTGGNNNVVELNIFGADDSEIHIDRHTIGVDCTLIICTFSFYFGRLLPDNIGKAIRINMEAFRCTHEIILPIPVVLQTCKIEIPL